MSNIASNLLRPTLRRTDRARAFTLAEAIIAVVITSGMLVASLNVIGSAAKSRSIQLERTKGSALARDLMAEVVRNRYKDPLNTVFGAEGGETRSTFDDIDDYNGYVETSAKARDGTVLPGAAGWTRRVDVAWVQVNDLVTVRSLDGHLKRITVTVTSPGGRVTSLVSLRADTGAADKTFTTAQTYVNRVNVTIGVGTDSNIQSVQSVATVNQVP
jgi:MSHA pilin protein MshD